ncbi:hypothetical protein ACVIHI_009125 [Bradyrhizobium sp. USDA 4524]|uniref:hypothetical protein n=1 Tax=unclassified Bradyrhizobium TaxID=2631580 RepID=UPI0020A05797|nr:MULTISPECIES: hypothetical protein [unclassified Bradyrhizobium]MCP1846096.1 hypothetical protein [Bradyrhizobium sp. USDA 4538]MCP1907270.1 hypothetical protein [Bradyrhizobium sp. USDA 4537]MCP1985745.1 hypothetical protein [Bradyrhizobium sp. USDA 4539]
MTKNCIEYTKEDIFLLGNIASTAVNKGIGEHVTLIISLIQDARPQNAGSFLLEAMYKYSIGKTREAIHLLETGKVFEAAINRDEAVAFHLFLLQQDGQIERAADLGQIYMDEGLVGSDSAREMIRIVTTECNAVLGRLIDGQDDVH